MTPTTTTNTETSHTTTTTTSTSTITSTATSNSAMAGAIKPPKPLAGGKNVATEWKSWLQQFEWFAAAIELYKKPSEVQVGTFMSVIGPDAVAVYETFDLTEVERKDLSIIKQRFQDHYTPRIRLTYERYNFNKIQQQPCEPFDDFLTKVQTQAKRCAFGTLNDDLVCDKIIIGIQSETVREQLLLQDNLKLEKAIQICRNYEQTSRQISDMHTAHTDTHIAVIKSKPERKSDTLTETFQCGRCGTRHSKKRNCPAFKKKCRKCKRRGHFEKMCRSTKPPKQLKRVRALDEVNSDDSEGYIYCVQSMSKSDDWYEVLRIGTKLLKVKLDSGAQCNVLSKSQAEKLKVEIKPSKTKRLVSYSEHTIQVIGEVCLDCVIKNNLKKVTFKVVEENLYPILGKKSCQELGLLVRVNSVTVEQEAEKMKLFNGLGCVKDFEYDIDLIDNPTFKIIPPRRIPHAIKADVKAELDNMFKLGVIKPVKEPTPVVSPLITVKKNGKLRVCVDPTELNKNIKRRHFPLKTVEEIAANIGDSKYFTLLDCKRGFWQLRVSHRSQKYLTFSTPWGRYSYLRVPFGIVSAPEIFTECVHNVLQGCKNTEISMDDILIHGKTEQELRTLTHQVMSRLQKAGITLNKEKCVFQTTSIKFLGHVFTSEGIKADPDKPTAWGTDKQKTASTDTRHGNLSEQIYY